MKNFSEIQVKMFELEKAVERLLVGFLEETEMTPQAMTLEIELIDTTALGDLKKSARLNGVCFRVLL